MVKSILWVVDPSNLEETESLHTLAERLIGEYRFGAKDHQPSRIIVNGNGVGIGIVSLLRSAGLPVEEVNETAQRPVVIPITFRSTP